MTSISPGMAAGSVNDSSLEQQAVRKAAWRFIPLLAI